MVKMVDGRNTYLGDIIQIENVWVIVFMGQVSGSKLHLEF